MSRLRGATAGGDGRAQSSRPSVPATGGGKNAPNIFQFFTESRAELRKVTWPTRQEATNLTVAVVGMTIGIAAFLGLIDGALDKIIKPLIGG
ncbi:MAG: hypothetical protein NVS9B15_11120 [Acidobacteriaceae bacterium]